MSEVLTNMVLAGVMTASGFVPLAAQDPADFSGEWVLVAATTPAGRTAGEGSQATGDRPTTSNVASGAAFNCGRACTIVLEGQTLTIQKAYLGSNTTPAPVVTLPLDGRQTTVVDSFSPRRDIQVTAGWQGNKLQIVSSTGLHAMTQVVSLETRQLVVVNAIDIEAAQPVTFRYEKR